MPLALRQPVWPAKRRFCPFGQLRSPLLLQGYVSATFFGLWAPDLNFNPAVLGNMTAHGCGKCGACKDWLQPRSPDPAPEVTVLCVEPGAIPYAELVLLREKVFPSARAGIVW